MPSFSLLYSMDEVMDPSLTVKVIGHQWYWSYELDVYRKDNLFDYFKVSLPRQKRFMELPQMVNLQKKLLNSFFARFASTTYFKFLKNYLSLVKTKPELFDLTIHIKRTKIFAIYRLLYDIRAKYSMKGMYFMRPFVDISPRKLPTLGNFFWLFEFICFEQTAKSSVSVISPSVKFDSYMVNENDLVEGGLRLLEVDNRLLLPTRTHIRLLVTSADVIHSWAVPSLGIKVDAIPGRLNQTGLYIKREGVFYGQCSELCGVNHGFMPIVVEAVEYKVFAKWARGHSNIKTLADLISSAECEVRIN